MLFNQNIILEILKSNFAKEIKEFTDSFVMSLDASDLGEIFESTVDFAMLDSIEEMEIEDYITEEEENVQNVEGTFVIVVSLDGYERINEHSMFKETSITNFGIGFSFYVENKVYSNLELEYLY